MSEANSPYILTKEISKEPADRALAKQIRKEVDLQIKGTAREIEEQSIPLSKPLKKCLGDLRHDYEEYYRRLGVRKIRWPKYVFQVPTPAASAEGKVKMGFSSLDIVAVAVPPEGIVDKLVLAKIPVGREREKKLKSLRDVVAACLFAHELYHSIPQRIMRVETKQSERGVEVEVGEERAGLVYLSRKDRRRGNAIEDGLAMKAQHQAEEVIAHRFPEEMKFLRTIKTAVSKEFPEVPADAVQITEFIFQLDKLGSEEVTYSYLDSVRLVEFLIDQVPDFIQLAERARVKGETVSLTRAIEKKFGPGSYRTIMLATEETAARVKEELEAKAASESGVKDR